MSGMSRIVFGVSIVRRPFPLRGTPRPHSSQQLHPSFPQRHPFRLIARASSEDQPGQMSSQLIEAMKNKIQTALEAEKVEVLDVEGDARHVTIDVVSSAFEGKSSVDRQRMVYKAIWLELQEAVHAVDSMTTKTPGEVTS